MFGGDIFGNGIFSSEGGEGGYGHVVAPMGTLFARGNKASAYLTAPMGVLFANGHNAYGENAAFLSAPMGTLSARFGGVAQLAAPMGVLLITATVTNAGRANLIAPIGLMSATGRVAGTAGAMLRAPMGTLFAHFGGAARLTVAGRYGLVARGSTGGVARAALTGPMGFLLAVATAENRGAANLTAPMGFMVQRARGVLTGPMGFLLAVGGSSVAATYEAYAVNLRHNFKIGPGDTMIDETTRFTNFPFDDIVRFGSNYYGFTASGMHLLGGATDNGDDISWEFKTTIDDFKSSVVKTIISAYFGGRLGPEADITLYVGDNPAVPYVYAYETPRGQNAQNYRRAFGRGIRDRYFALGVASQDELELDTIELEMQNMTRRI